MKKILQSLLILLFIAITSTGYAAPILFTGSSGTHSASVYFDTSGTNLLVTLSNTSTNDVLVPVDVLTGVFFNISPILTPVSATLHSGSTVFYGPSNGGNLGGEWANVNNQLNGIRPPDGISSSGLGIFGSGNFGGANLQGPSSTDGLQYGLTSAGDNLGTGNAAVTGGFALTQYSVDFILSGLPGGFDPSTGITNVLFQYGTGLDEPTIPGNPPSTPVPEPGTMVLLGSGLIGLAGWGRKKFHK